MIQRCPSCNKKNRRPLNKLAAVGKCGVCGDPLPPIDEPLEVGEKEFDSIVGSAKVPVLVDFWAAWCGPCKMAAPEVKKVASQMAGKAIVLKVDTDRHPALAKRFDVSGIPNFLVLQRGNITMQQPGLVRSSQLREWLEEAAGTR